MSPDMMQKDVYNSTHEVFLSQKSRLNLINILDLTTNPGNIRNREYDKQHHIKKVQCTLECGKLRTNNMIYYNQIIAKEKKWEGIELIDQRYLKDQSNAKFGPCLEPTVS